MYKLITTDELWDFVDKYIPNHLRDSYEIQSQLQLFIDGHESPIKGITKEEAVELHEKTLFPIFAESIHEYTFGRGHFCENCASYNTNYCPECGRKLRVFHAISIKELAKTVLLLINKNRARFFLDTDMKDWFVIQYMDQSKSAIQLSHKGNITLLNPDHAGGYSDQAIEQYLSSVTNLKPEDTVYLEFISKPSNNNQESKK